ARPGQSVCNQQHSRVRPGLAPGRLVKKGQQQLHGARAGGAEPSERPPRLQAGPGTAARAPRGCANLTLILDNWRFAITSQLRNLLLFHHHTVLPDYGRIRALSGALDELYEDFSALKEQLGRLSGRFVEVEAFVDQLSRSPGPRTAPRPGPRRRGLPQPALK
uniref:Uncharacterized protein n=1 Tax=Gallus gallus TaxID=9031 RepID=A0A8V1AIR8_CHICK